MATRNAVRLWALLSAVGLLVSAGPARADTLVWNGDTANWNSQVSGHYRWILDGGWKLPVSGDVCNVNSGTTILYDWSPEFPARLNVNSGGTVKVEGSGGHRVAEGLYLNNGGKIHVASGTVRITGTGSATTITATGTSTIQVDAGNLSLLKYVGETDNSTLTGDGTINKTGAGQLFMTTLASTYTGTLNINAGSVVLVTGTGTFGGTIQINSGAKLTEGDFTKTWTIGDGNTRGLTLNGGTLESTGGNGIVYSNTKLTINNVVGGSFVDVAARSNWYAHITLSGASSSLAGSGDLTVETHGNASGLSLANPSSAYSGTITVNPDSYLLLGNSGALSGSASLVLLESGGAKGQLTVGAYCPGGAMPNVPVNVSDVDITVNTLTLGGTAIPADTYDQANPLPVSGYVTFNNATSSLTVLAIPEPATVGFLAIGGLAMAGGTVLRRRRA